MMTTVSIDTVGSASDAVTSVNAVTCREGGSDIPVASDKAAALFQQTLAGQATENAALGETMRAAMVSVSETLTKVDAAATEAQATVSVAAVPVDAFIPNASVAEGSIRSDAIGTIASTETISSTVQLPTLPQQIASNATLETDLTAASALVDETLTKVNAAATEAQSTVNAANPTIVDATTVPVDAFVPNASVADGTVRSDAIETIASPETTTSTVQLPTLPQQIASNATLATDLTAASALVGETLTQVNAAATEAQSTVNAANPTIVDATTAPVDAFVPNASVAEGTVRSDAIETIASTEDDAAISVSDETPQTVADIPEATADALVAAGVVPQAATPVTSVETPVAQTVAAVDAVAAKAAIPSADVLIQAASAVADTLLVSPGLLRGQGEVLVQLRPDVLQGTEVKISVIGRQLEVVFQPQTVDMAVMIENCRSQITQHLAAKIATFNVSVDVRKKRG